MTSNLSLDERISAICFPDEDQEWAIFDDPRYKLVHYTSSDSAFKILGERKLCLKNARYMNDETEITYATDIFIEIYNKNFKNKYYDLLKNLGNNFANDFDKFISSGFDSIINYTYISCFSEQKLRSQNSYNSGRLSMWRAYGGKNPVMMIVNNNILDDINGVNGITLIKINYNGAEYIEEELERFFIDIQINMPYLLSIRNKSDIIDIFRQFTRKITFNILSVKHDFFKEEKEWRIVYMPTQDSSVLLKSEVLSINNNHQVVYKLDINKVIEINELKNISDIFSEIIIGPSANQRMLWESFTHLYAECDIDNITNRIKILKSPLRAE